MKPEYHLFIIWENARHKEQDIVKDITEGFEVLYKLNITWSKEHFSTNLTRFYGTNLPPNSGKEVHIGTGSFLTIIVKDKEPKYRNHHTSNGKKYINSRTFLAKTKYRDLTGGGHKIHGTNTPTEFSHDFALLLGCTLDEFMKKHKPRQDETIEYKRDLVGHAGWESLEQVFDILNLTDKYVVMRNFEPLPSEFYTGKHGDIDFLVKDYDTTRYILNATSIFLETYRVHNKITVAGEEVMLDIRYIGDEYYDKNWQRDMLKHSTRHKNVNIMIQEDHFYSLLYHATIHKPEVADDYVVALNEMNQENRYTDDIIDQSWFKKGRAQKVLGEYLAKKGYKVTKPEPSVYFNEKNVRYVNDILSSNRLKEILEFDSVLMFHTGPQADERRYYKAKRGGDVFFVKSGSRDYEHEFTMAKRVYAQNPKFFARPVDSVTGKINYFVTEWVNGVGLDEFIKNNPTKHQREALVDELPKIHKALKEAGVVHRDITPRNLIVVDGCRLVLIDFYWAVESNNYKEYDYIKDDIRSINKLGESFAAGLFMWDDAASLVKLAQYILDNKNINRASVKKISKEVGKVVIRPSGDVFYNTIEEKQREVMLLSDKTKDLSRENEGLLKNIEILTHRMREQQDQIHNMELSSSWRITKPLRSLKSIAKRAKLR